MTISRRLFLTGLVAAPAVLRLGLWMPVKAQPLVGFTDYDLTSAEARLARAIQNDLTVLMANNTPIRYNDSGIKLISDACTRAITAYDPVAWQAHVDRVFNLLYGDTSN